MQIDARMAIMGRISAGITISFAPEIRSRRRRCCDAADRLPVATAPGFSFAPAHSAKGAHRSSCNPPAGF